MVEWFVIIVVSWIGEEISESSKPNFKHKHIVTGKNQIYGDGEVNW